MADPALVRRVALRLIGVGLADDVASGTRLAEAVLAVLAIDGWVAPDTPVYCDCGLNEAPPGLHLPWCSTTKGPTRHETILATPPTQDGDSVPSGS